MTAAANATAARIGVHLGRRELMLGFIFKFQAQMETRAVAVVLASPLTTRKATFLRLHADHFSCSRTYRQLERHNRANSPS
jgi:hypothetical protein